MNFQQKVPYHTCSGSEIPFYDPGFFGAMMAVGGDRWIVGQACCRHFSLVMVARGTLVVVCYHKGDKPRKSSPKYEHLVEIDWSFTMKQSEFKITGIIQNLILNALGRISNAACVKDLMSISHP